MIHSFVSKFVKEEDGQDLVEYSLLLGFIALAAAAALPALKTSITGVFTKIQTKLNSVN